MTLQFDNVTVKTINKARRFGGNVINMTRSTSALFAAKTVKLMLFSFQTVAKRVVVTFKFG